MGRGPTNSPQNSSNDHLTKTKIWRRRLRISIVTTLKTLDPIHHKGVRLTLGTFAVYPTGNVLNEAGISKLVEIREQDTSRIAIKVITNESHLILTL
jgi:hypothetical protein